MFLQSGRAVSHRVGAAALQNQGVSGAVWERSGVLALGDPYGMWFMVTTSSFIKLPLSPAIMWPCPGWSILGKRAQATGP
jgi:hypothetical protein